MPSIPAIELLRMMDAPRARRGSALDRKVGALDVGVEDPVEVLLRRLGEWDELGDAGIHEQHIEPAELTAYLVHDMVEVSRDGDVRSNGDELIGPRELAELRPGRPQRARITPGNDHARTGLEKLLGGGEADAAVAARDQGDLAGEAARHRRGRGGRGSQRCGMSGHGGPPGYPLWFNNH